MAKNFISRVAGNCAKRSYQYMVRSTYDLFPKPKRKSKRVRPQLKTGFWFTP